MEKRCEPRSSRARIKTERMTEQRTDDDKRSLRGLEVTAHKTAQGVSGKSVGLCGKCSVWKTPRIEPRKTVGTYKPRKDRPDTAQRTRGTSVGWFGQCAVSTKPHNPTAQHHQQTGQVLDSVYKSIKISSLWYKFAYRLVSGPCGYFTNEIEVIR